VAVLGAIVAIPVHAQDATPENDENCVACHEHEYYVYDNGKWFCLCDAPMHCVYCHGGRTDSSIEEVAHEGLVLYPTREHASRCQTCHGEDYLSRVVAFSNVAGISSTPQPVVTATAVEPASSPVGQHPTLLLVRFSQLEPWRQAVVGALALALVGVAIFGYRCWKADCLAKTMRL
jgi:hypothetical protein